ncbi:IgGFc-binding protein-like [Pecten maximus]|uniref:IgGFc-binding protein-like n=1 Tax=Pecten maximus TaxID=6579 RepID=UPI0014587121|nr:IgGFc-binding protein-like [Pecten maximus]
MVTEVVTQCPSRAADNMDRTFLAPLLLLILFDACQSSNRYMVGFMENSKYPKWLSVFIRAKESGAAVRIRSHSENEPKLNSEYLIQPNATILIKISKEYEVTGTNKSVQGISIESDQELFILIHYWVESVYQYTSTSCLAIPVSSLGLSYYAVTENNRAEILIIGIYNDTSLRVTGNIPFKYNQVTTDVLTETINEFETVQLQADSGSLTGTHIHADKVVSVYSGNKYFNQRVLKNPLIQQLSPVNVWGTVHITLAPLHCDYNVIIVTGSADTIVNSSCGQTFELTEAGSSTYVAMGNSVCQLESNHPVSVTMIVLNEANPLSNSSIMVRVQPLQQVKELVFFDTNYEMDTSLILVSDVKEILLDNGPISLSSVRNTSFYFIRSPVSSGHHVISCDPACSVSAYVFSYGFQECIGYLIISNEHAEH